MKEEKGGRRRRASLKEECWCGRVTEEGKGIRGERRDSLVNDTASHQLKHLLLLGLLVEHTVEPD